MQVWSSRAGDLQGPHQDQPRPDRVRLDEDVRLTDGDRARDPGRERRQRRGHQLAVGGPRAQRSVDCARVSGVL